MQYAAHVLTFLSRKWSLAVRVDLDYVNVPERYEEGEISKLETAEGIKIIARFLASAWYQGREKEVEKGRKIES